MLTPNNPYVSLTISSAVEVDDLPDSNSTMNKSILNALHIQYPFFVEYIWMKIEFLNYKDKIFLINLRMHSVLQSQFIFYFDVPLKKSIVNIHTYFIILCVHHGKCSFHYFLCHVILSDLRLQSKSIQS